MGVVAWCNGCNSSRLLIKHNIGHDGLGYFASMFLVYDVFGR